jgi:hypothetical protein
MIINPGSVRDIGSSSMRPLLLFAALEPVSVAVWT